MKREEGLEKVVISENCAEFYAKQYDLSSLNLMQEITGNM